MKFLALTSLTVFSLIFSFQAFAISADKCQSTDWFAVGRDSGVKGQPSDKIMSTHMACQKKGVDISLEQYQKGWQMGISEYCSPDNAFNLGFRKKSTSKYCPIDMKADFDQFYAWGKEAFGLEKQVKKKESQLKSKVKALNSATKKKESLEKQVKTLEEQTKGLNEKVDAIESQMKKKRSVIKKASDSK